jgi:molecular chaperone GrpE
MTSSEPDFSSTPHLLWAFNFAAELDDRDRAHREELRELLVALFEVMDSFDRFLAASSTEPPQAESYLRTCRLIARQFESVLQRTGVTVIGRVGEPADPRQHEVVGDRPAAGVVDDMVVEVVRRGYELNGWLLRPAQVIVATIAQEGAR